MIKEFQKISKIEGELNLPGDKSISHRSVMFSAMAEGESKIFNLSNGEDVKSSQKCFRQLGAEIIQEKDYIIVKGCGFKGFKKPSAPLDAGNSGTTARLISGILIAQDFESELIGDEYLSIRPMKRIVTPLTAMGGKIMASEKFTLPLKFFPADEIVPINYELPMASAQVKSAILLAGLYSEKPTTVIEKIPSRDHTEKMLGLKTIINEQGKINYSSKENYPVPKEYYVPSDISTAAFFIVLTLLSKDSSLRIKNVSLNETRTGIIEVLKKMGGHIEVDNFREAAGEPLGDIIIVSSNLKNIDIPVKIIPNIIDEIPVLAIAGILSHGEFTIRNAEELRGKETDRINALCYNFRLLGLAVNEYDDGFEVSGKIKNKNVVFESFNDHRIAMAFSILSFLLDEGGKVNNFDCVNISNPDFLLQVNSITR
ncbi:MAG: 3-phosphoshikimate 1-carboxyvinyltransferase [Ignavibacteriaceae bacterium]